MIVITLSLIVVVLHSREAHISVTAADREFHHVVIFP